ncbi:MAG: YncE family protein [Calditrichaeota bacterium]|nr:YncE family protein [Calditrichota bacterium]
MRKTFLTFIFALIMLTITLTSCESVSPSSPTLAPEGALFVANFSDHAGNLSMLNTESGEVTVGIAGLGDTPNDILYRNDKLYVINSASNSLDILGFNEDHNLMPIETVDIGSGPNKSPMFGDFSSDGKLIISNFNDSTVTILNPNTPEIQEFVKVGLSPSDIKVIDNKAYVCNSGFNLSTFGYESGTISVIDIETKTVVDLIDVGINPQYLDVDSQGRLHVVCTGNYSDVMGEISIIDTQTNTVVNTVDIGGKPAELVITSDDDAYLAAFGIWGEENPGLVFRYNAISGAVLNNSDNPIEVGNGASRVVAGSDGEVYVACFGADSIDKIVGDAVVASYLVGDGPTPMLITGE